MTRYTFGGNIHDIVPAADSSGTLKLAPNVVLPLYSAAAGGSVVTDFLVDNDGDGTYEAAVSQIVTGTTSYIYSFQGPDGVTTLWYDPDPTDADVRRVRWDAFDASTSGVPLASETTPGLVKFATSAAATTGSDTNSALTPADGADIIDQHVNDPNAHPTYADAIDNLLTAVNSKADLVGGLVPVDEIPGVTAATGDTIVQRRSGGTIGTATATADDDAVPLAQAKDLLTALSGSDVRALTVASGSLPVSAPSTTFVTIPDVAVTDAATGQVWRCEYDLIYQATAGAGLQVRVKTGAATPTNLLANPSFETDLSGWSGSGPVTAARNTTGGGFSGSAYATLTATGASPLQWISDWVQIGGQALWSAGAYVRLNAGTARQIRVDVQWGDANGSVLTTSLGSAGNGVTTPTTSWAQITNGATNGLTPPAGATQARVRLVYGFSPGLPVVGDAVDVDAIQLEPSTPLPAYGSTGGSGSSALAVVGSWGPGLTTGATSSDNYSKITPLRAPTVSNLTSQHGGLGIGTDAFLAGSFEVTVVGGGLVNQRIELEFAQRVTDGANPTRLTAAKATFARIA